MSSISKPNNESVSCLLEKRFFTLGNPKCKKLLYVIHGYGQLPEYFIQKFHVFSDEYFIVAPEGLSHYYLEGVSGRVGASWMTKEDRLRDIENINHYLSQVHKKITDNQDFEEIFVLGFSQGVPVAVRWICSENLPIKKILLCSGMLPPELTQNQLNYLKQTEIHYFTGLSDPFRDEGLIQEFYALVEGYQLTLNIHEFEGVHEVHIPTISEVILEN